jgi:hypothetical protein
MTKTLLDKYSINLNDILVEIKIVLKSDEFVPQYVSTIANISETTKIVLEKIREEYISSVNIGIVDIANDECHLN